MLTLNPGALDIESEIEKSHIRTTDGSLIKLETRPFQPLSVSLNLNQNSAEAYLTERVF